MNVIEINRTSHKHSDYYGVVKFDYDEIVMIANALYQYHKNTESEAMKQMSYTLKKDWNNFRDMVCYGSFCESLVKGNA